MNRSSRDELILFVKTPIPGLVKTRLVPPLTFKEAAQLYKSWAQGLYRTAQQVVNIKITVAYQSTAEIPSPAWLDGVDGEVNYFEQCAGDLGEKISHAFDRAFSKGANKAIIIGTDSPGLPLNTLQQAFEKLDEYDLTVGPTYDGGYYLIGLKGKPRPELFSGIAWSTSSVLSQTLLKAKGLTLSFHLLPKYFDIDTPEDLKKFNDTIICHPSG